MLRDDEAQIQGLVARLSAAGALVLDRDYYDRMGTIRRGLVVVMPGGTFRLLDEQNRVSSLRALAEELAAPAA